MQKPAQTLAHGDIAPLNPVDIDGAFLPVGQILPGAEPRVGEGTS